jgi:hypothetical protein
MTRPSAIANSWITGNLTIMIIKGAAQGEGLQMNAMGRGKTTGSEAKIRTEYLRGHARHHPQNPRRTCDRRFPRNQPRRRLRGDQLLLSSIGSYSQTLAVTETSLEYSCQIRFPMDDREMNVGALLNSGDKKAEG